MMSAVNSYHLNQILSFRDHHLKQLLPGLNGRLLLFCLEWFVQFCHHLLLLFFMWFLFVKQLFVVPMSG